VTCLAGGAGRPIGYVLVFYDITEFVSADDASSVRPGVRRRLTKIPTVANQRIVFVDADDILSIHSDGHYTRVVTASANRFCNLSIGDIESRLDPDHFMRVHRSHIVNLRAVAQLLRKEGRLALQLEEAPEPIPVSRTSAGALLERLGVPAGGGTPVKRQGNS
jgi:DNA-binding LytR/AlgR family response regulator